MITEKEFRQLLDKTVIKRYKNVNDAWTLSATYPLSLEQPNQMRGFSSCGMPKASWAKSKTAVTRKLYEKLARIWGFYGDITQFMK